MTYLHPSAPAVPRYPVPAQGKSKKHAHYKTNPKLTHSLSPATHRNQKSTNEPNPNRPTPPPAQTAMITLRFRTSLPYSTSVLCPLA
jgi:hypothetical protein